MSAAVAQMVPLDAANPLAVKKPLLKKITPELIAIAVVAVIVIMYMLFGNSKKAGTVGVNKACKADSDCSGGACAHDPNNPSLEACCPSANKVSYWFKKYCGSQATGSKCLNDKMCAGGNCGVLDAAKSHVKGCCANGTMRHLFKKYCAGQASGANCRTDGMCSSGKCSGNLFGLKLGKCK